MRTAIRRQALAVVMFCATVAALRADNWPQWRGPLLNGSSRERDLPLRWSKTENVAWKLALPALSASTPAVWGNRVFVTVADDQRVTTGENLHLWCVDRTTGMPLWKRPLGAGNRQTRKADMASPSPITDGQRVWAMTGTGVLKAFDASGRELWARDLQREYGRFGLMYGYASSPLLYDNALFVQVLHGSNTHDPSYVLRIDPASGRTVWRVERPTRARYESADAYTTPAVVRVGSAFELIITGGDVVTGHDLATGRELWRAGGLNPTDDGNYRIVASPVVSGDLIIAPTRERPMLALKGGGLGDVTRSHVLWSFNSGPDVPTPVLGDDSYLYIVNDRGLMWCLEARTGREIYARKRLPPATYSGSPVLAGDRIYITNEDGLTTIVKAGPAFEILSTNDLDDHTLSSPAVSDGQIFIRTARFLYCIGQRRTSAS